MSISVMAVVALLATVAGMVAGELVSKEIRGRLDQLPQALLRLAARRLPCTVREDIFDEWDAELHVILRGAEALPITRVFRGVRFALGLFRAGPAIGRELEPATDPEDTAGEPSRTFAGAIAAVAVRASSSYERCPRCPTMRRGSTSEPCALCSGKGKVPSEVAAKERGAVEIWRKWLEDAWRERLQDAEL